MEKIFLKLINKFQRLQLCVHTVHKRKKYAKNVLMLHKRYKEGGFRGNKYVDCNILGWEGM